MLLSTNKSLNHTDMTNQTYSLISILALKDNGKPYSHIVYIVYYDIVKTYEKLPNHRMEQHNTSKVGLKHRQATGSRL